MATRVVPASRYAVGLYRVSTAEQGQSGLGLEAQQAAVRAFAAAQGWTLVAEYTDVASGKDDRRPGFQAALARCRQLGAVLAAARLDRITRRAHTLSQLLEDGYSIRAADLPSADDLMMRLYAAIAQRERELISERTRAALGTAAFLTPNGLVADIADRRRFIAYLAEEDAAWRGRVERLGIRLDE